ncbi:MAG: glutaredoxin family protein [Proteobacteria bacterium]|nr:glutaredoxin family protein [Desulfobacteraceae bacterium]MBU4002457.1 glutaredoxin family protein [Pseudomonadota bacterium]MBU4316582.1 glutaredoxin family protein [Pseudomonadota bacterium]MBU4470484.1 glutaredoxin family protein [Pseudomonadota bacterium]
MPAPTVMVFSLSTCSHCKSAKRFLDDCKVQYEHMDVDLLTGDERKKVVEDVKKLNPKCSFPTIKIGDKVVVGFKETEIKEALGL